LLIISLKGFSKDQPVIRSVKISGNNAFSKGELKSQMNTRPKTLIEMITFRKSVSQYNTVILEDDIERLRNHYIRNGYPSSEIKQEVTISRNGNKAYIKISIDENRPVRIGSVTWPALSDGEQQDILKKVTGGNELQIGRIFTDQDIYAAENRILKAFTGQGYPLARIDRRLSINIDTSEVDVLFGLKPGPLLYFGKISITGDSLVPQKYIKQHVSIKTGEIYSVMVMDKTQQRLTSLDLFRSVIIRSYTDSITDNRIPVVIRVSELPRWTLKAGAGYGTEDRFRLYLNLTKRNFLGGARKLVLDAKHSYFYPAALDLNFIQPNFPLYRVDFLMNPFYIFERERSFEAQRAGIDITTRKDLGQRSSIWLSLGYEKSILTDLTNDKSLSLTDQLALNHYKSGLTLGTVIDRSNDLFEPTKGWKFNASFTLTGLGLPSDYSYYKTIAGLTGYLNISSVTIASRLRAGLLQPTGSQTVSPVEERFLIGGASSLRGWSYNAISPLDLAGNQTGGNSMLEGSVELRFSLYEIFGGVLFLEAGNVWNEAFNHTLTDLRYNTGIGIRIKTPAGPGRIDIATPLFEEKIKPQLFITIGHAF